MIAVYFIMLAFFFGYGAFLRYRAPKEIGHRLGFPTEKSRRSQDNWDEANYQFGGWLIQSGIFTVILIILTTRTPLKDAAWSDWLLLIPIGLIPLSIRYINTLLND